MRFLGLISVMTNWQKKSKRKIILEVCEIVVPVLFCVALVLLINGILKKPKNKTKKQIKPFLTRRVFSPTGALPDIFRLSLKKEFRLKSMLIKYPEDWVRFLDEQFGGMTLTIQPNSMSDNGMHIQCSRITDKIDTYEEGKNFLEKINLPFKKHSKTTVLSVQADVFVVNYLSKSSVPMRAKFIFLKNKGYMVRIIIFSPENSFDYREKFFNLIVETIRFS